MQRSWGASRIPDHETEEYYPFFAPGPIRPKRDIAVDVTVMIGGSLTTVALAITVVVGKSDGVSRSFATGNGNLTQHRVDRRQPCSMFPYPPANISPRMSGFGDTPAVALRHGREWLFRTRLRDANTAGRACSIRHDPRGCGSTYLIKITRFRGWKRPSPRARSGRRAFGRALYSRGPCRFFAEPQPMKVHP